MTVWLDDRQGVCNPRSNAKKNNEDQSIEGGKCRPLWRLSVQNLELMAQGGDFGFPRGARSEQPGKDRPDELDLVHHTGKHQPIRHGAPVGLILR